MNLVHDFGLPDKTGERWMNTPAHPLIARMHLTRLQLQRKKPELTARKIPADRPVIESPVKIELPDLNSCADRHFAYSRKMTNQTELKAWEPEGNAP
ncbi:hypothetical protein [Paraburkholderia unamae]|uniref:hypothetical protein n=1 Tax=Paraburkholderia unamae TaxID=219649 RepID=UPI00105803E0|nr:hypothetical protein [Paraburkholderia unamae]